MYCRNANGSLAPPLPELIFSSKKTLATHSGFYSISFPLNRTKLCFIQFSESNTNHKGPIHIQITPTQAQHRRLEWHSIDFCMLPVHAHKCSIVSVWKIPSSLHATFHAQPAIAYHPVSWDVEFPLVYLPFSIWPFFPRQVCNPNCFHKLRFLLLILDPVDTFDVHRKCLKRQCIHQFQGFKPLCSLHDVMFLMKFQCVQRSLTISIRHCFQYLC